MKFRTIFQAGSIISACLLSLVTQAQPAAGPQLDDEGMLTFSIRAPQATRVQLTSGGDIPQIPSGRNLDLEKQADGLWQLTIGPMAGGSYRYAFDVDGVRTTDPANSLTSESNMNAWSYLHVPGSEWMDTLDVPHGAVSEVYYHSGVLGRSRRMHVYTPPGYNSARKDSYPVFYLLHGAYDSDDAWSTVGRAGFILDNLIASGAAPAMIVVMPDGHTAAFGPGQDMRLEEFVSEFRQDIKPYIESHFPVRTDRDGTAIAGLSMGGAQTLEIAFSELDEYGYVGVYSSGIFTITQDDSWQQAHAATLADDSLKDGLHLLWFATGSEDFLLETSKASVALLQDHGFDVQWQETAGGHTWINWREYLHVFTPQLFR